MTIRAVTSLGLQITITRPVSASGYRIMLTSLPQFQAQGWEKWLSQITFTRGTNSLKSNLKSSQISPSNCWVRKWELNNFESDRPQVRCRNVAICYATFVHSRSLYNLVAQQVITNTQDFKVMDCT